MLSKNCRSILDAVLSLDQNDWYKAYSVNDLTQLTSLSTDEICSAVTALEENGMLQVHYFSFRSCSSVIDSVRLTEQGIHYKDLEKENRLNYLKDKWIDFFALIIALIALLKSYESEIIALLQK